MAYEKYKTQRDGKTVTLYRVKAEAINKFTSKRIQKQKSGISSKTKAEVIYRELWNECKNEHPLLPSIKNWGELRDMYVQSCRENIRSEKNPDGIAKGTYWNKRNYLNKLVNVQNENLKEQQIEKWGELSIELITPDFVRTELNAHVYNEIFSVSEAARVQKELKATFSYAVDIGLLTHNPLLRLKKRKVPTRLKVALNHPEASKLLFEAKRRNHPYFLIWLLSIFLGCRRSELAGLKWTDIDLTSRIIYFDKQWIPGEGLVSRTKGKEPRPAPIHSSLIPILKEYQLKTTSDHVIDIDDSDWRWGNQAKVIREFCREIGIKEVTHHELRNTFIMLCFADGVPLAFVKEAVGHKKLSTTDEYYTASGLKLKGSTDVLSVKIPALVTGEVLSIHSEDSDPSDSLAR